VREGPAKSLPHGFCVKYSTHYCGLVSLVQIKVLLLPQCCTCFVNDTTFTMRLYLMYVMQFKDFLPGQGHLLAVLTLAVLSLLSCTVCCFLCALQTKDVLLQPMRDLPGQRQLFAVLTLAVLSLLCCTVCFLCALQTKDFLLQPMRDLPGQRQLFAVLTLAILSLLCCTVCFLLCIADQGLPVAADEGPARSGPPGCCAYLGRLISVVLYCLLFNVHCRPRTSCCSR
jgi:hypothetical protein